MSMINRPHDKFFKEVMGNVENTRDFLINYLPEDILKVTDLDNLTLEKDSYIDEELKESFSDRLFKTRINGKEGYIYFLFEHKSYQSPQTALQLLKYMVKIWEQKYHQENKAHLPAIIPTVIYHGENKWKIAPSLGALFQDVPESIK